MAQLEKLTPSRELEQVAVFYEDRIEVVELKNGGQAFIQRPKPREAGIQAVSADDLPDDFTAGVAAVSSTDKEIYRISFTPLEIVLTYEPAVRGVKVSVKLVVPVVGSVGIGSVRGSIKEGVLLKIGYKALAQGRFGAKGADGKATIFWSLKAFGKGYEDDLVLFSL